MTRIISLVALFASACGGDVDGGCPAPLTPEAEIDLVVPAGVVASDIEVTGTIGRPEGLAVFRVFVAGVAADSKDGNYSRFSAKLPLATLVQMLGKITVEVETNCAIPTFERTFTVQLASSPTVPQLAIVGVGPLPTTLPASRLVTVTSDLSAVGATVMLTTTLGTFDGGSATTSRTFVTDGGRAAAFASLIGVPPSGGMLPAGLTTVLATSGGKSVSTIVEFLAPPVLSPAASIVAAPGTFSLNLRNDDRPSTCRATPTTGFTFLFDGRSIAQTEHTSGANAIAVEATGAALPGSSATITCRDALGQTTTATIAIPAPP